MKSNIFLSHGINPFPSECIQILSLMSIDTHNLPNLPINRFIHNHLLLTDYLIIIINIPLLFEMPFRNRTQNNGSSDHLRSHNDRVHLILGIRVLHCLYLFGVLLIEVTQVPTPDYPITTLLVEHPSIHTVPRTHCLFVHCW